MRNNNHPIGVGVVGLGKFGEFSLAAYTEMEEVRVVAVCDEKSARAQALAPQGARAYEKFEDLLADPQLELVVISTPPVLHGPMAIRAARAGKHVLVEKPLALNLAEAEAAIAVARQNGVLLTVDYVLRFHLLYQVVGKIVERKLFGGLQLFSLVNLATDEGLTPDHWFWDPAQSGGILVEHGVHFFDLCDQFLKDRPSVVQGYALRGPRGRVDRVGVVVQYGNDALATFYHSFNRPRCIEQTTVHLALAHGEIVVEGWIPVRLTLHGLLEKEKLPDLQALLGEGLKRTYPRGDRVEVQAEVHAPERQKDYKHAIQAVMRDLVRAIKEHRQPTVTPGDALSSLGLALAATESMFRGFPAPERFQDFEKR